MWDAVTGRFARARADRPDEVTFPGDAGPYFGALLTSPPFAAAIAEMGRVVRTRGESPGGYSHADRELADQVIQWQWRWHGVQRTHLPDALAVGVRREAIEALRDGRDDLLSEHERLIATYVRQVISGTVTDESFAAVTEELGHRAAVEYTMFVAFLLMTLRLHQAFDVPVLTAEEVDQMLADYRDGRRSLPEARHRFG
jgi:hypothetical protein